MLGTGPWGEGGVCVVCQGHVEFWEKTVPGVKAIRQGVMKDVLNTVED